MNGKNTVPLSKLPVGETASVVSVELDADARRRITDLGFGKGARVSCVGVSTLGDPRAYSSRGRTLALRSRDAIYIICTIGEKNEDR